MCTRHQGQHTHATSWTRSTCVHNIMNKVKMCTQYQGQHMYATSWTWSTCFLIYAISRSTHVRDIMNMVNMFSYLRNIKSTHVRDIMNMVNMFSYLRNIKVNTCTRHHEHGQHVFLFTQHQGQHMYVRSWTRPICVAKLYLTSCTVTCVCDITVNMYTRHHGQHVYPTSRSTCVRDIMNKAETFSRTVFYGTKKVGMCSRIIFYVMGQLLFFSPSVDQHSCVL